MTLKTLIVDDEPIAREVLREELESIADAEVIGEAGSGPAALAKIAECHPDLVLLDLRMPGMTGLEVVRHLGGGPRLLVIVIVTACEQYALEAFDAGAIDYLWKPVGHDRLAEAVQRAGRMTGKQALEQLAQLPETGDSRGGAVSRKIVGKVGEEYFLRR